MESSGRRASKKNPPPRHRSYRSWSRNCRRNLGVQKRMLDPPSTAERPARCSAGRHNPSGESRTRTEGRARRPWVGLRRSEVSHGPSDTPHASRHRTAAALTDDVVDLPRPGAVDDGAESEIVGEGVAKDLETTGEEGAADQGRGADGAVSCRQNRVARLSIRHRSSGSPGGRADRAHLSKTASSPGCTYSNRPTLLSAGPKGSDGMTIGVVVSRRSGRPVYACATGTALAVGETYDGRACAGSGARRLAQRGAAAKVGCARSRAGYR